MKNDSADFKIQENLQAIHCHAGFLNIFGVAFYFSHQTDLVTLGHQNHLLAIVTASP